MNSARRMSPDDTPQSRRAADAALDWARDGADWPLREHSRFVEAAGLRWHVQRLGESARSVPRVLLVHGTGSATHSWRDLAPLLAHHAEVWAMDLPGHGFTTALDGGPVPGEMLSLPGMARALDGLLMKLAPTPAAPGLPAWPVVIGHSAGAALLALLWLDGALAPRLMVSLNGALMGFRGLPGLAFKGMARVLAATPLMPQLVAWRAARPEAMRRLIEGTGSALDARGAALYARLAGHPAHAAAVIGMVSRWDLDALEADLPGLGGRDGLLQLVSGGADQAVPPWQGERVARRVQGARHTVLAGLGHLAHEESPQAVAGLIEALMAERGLR